MWRLNTLPNPHEAVCIWQDRLFVRCFDCVKNKINQSNYDLNAFALSFCFLGPQIFPHWYSHLCVPLSMLTGGHRFASVFKIIYIFYLCVCVCARAYARASMHEMYVSQSKDNFAVSLFPPPLYGSRDWSPAIHLAQQVPFLSEPLWGILVLFIVYILPTLGLR